MHIFGVFFQMDWNFYESDTKRLAWCGVCMFSRCLLWVSSEDTQVNLRLLKLPRQCECERGWLFSVSASQQPAKGEAVIHNRWMWWWGKKFYNLLQLRTCWRSWRSWIVGPCSDLVLTSILGDPIHPNHWNCNRDITRPPFKYCRILGVVAWEEELTSKEWATTYSKSLVPSFKFGIKCRTWSCLLPFKKCQFVAALNRKIQ